MDCRIFQEQVSAAVDNYLQQEEMEAMLDHATKCPTCRYEYEIERITKSVIRTKSKLVRTPSSVLQSITDQLAKSPIDTHRSSSRPSWIRSSFFKPAVAFAFACLLVILLLNLPQEHPTQGRIEASLVNDVISQSLSNFDAVASGAITPELVSNQPEQLQAFFTGKTEFPVLVPRMRDCNLVGGVLNEYAGTKLAHVVYRHDDKVVYMYQACWETVLKGEQLNLPKEVKEELQRTGWFAKSLADGHSVILWTKGKTLCAAVARMTREELTACLAAEENSPNSPW